LTPPKFALNNVFLSSLGPLQQKQRVSSLAGNPHLSRPHSSDSCLSSWDNASWPSSANSMLLKSYGGPTASLVGLLPYSLFSCEALLFSFAGETSTSRAIWHQQMPVYDNLSSPTPVAVSLVLFFFSRLVIPVPLKISPRWEILPSCQDSTNVGSTPSTVSRSLTISIYRSPPFFPQIRPLGQTSWGVRPPGNPARLIATLFSQSESLRAGVFPHSKGPGPPFCRSFPVSGGSLSFPPNAFP